MIERSEYAKQLFKEGYNCSQSVVLAFSDVTGLDKDMSLRIASPFGGGMGRLREVCGAVSGAFIVIGSVMGYSDQTNPQLKKDLYAVIQEFAGIFKEKNGSIVCRELLSKVKTTDGAIPEERNEAFYKKRPCLELIGDAAQITEDILKKYKIIGED